MINGKTLTLKDVAIYSTRGDIPNEAGASAIKGWISNVKTQAKNQGFTTLIIDGRRVENSSSANTGKNINLVFDLLK